MNLIVDASVAMKWFVKESGSAEALELRGSHNLAAPDILLIECRNAFLNKVRRQIISRDQASKAESEFDVSEVAILSSAPFLSDAFRMALDLGGAIYDCIYLASAISSGRMLITADERFSARAAASTFAAGHVKLLSELAAGP